MLITFKSKAAADVIMYKEHAKRILDLLELGKDVNRGVLTTAELGPAIARLEAEVAEWKLHSAADEVTVDIQAHHGAAGDDHEHEPSELVSFPARVYPLLEMMRAARRDNHVVAWGI